MAVLVVRSRVEHEIFYDGVLIGTIEPHFGNDLDSGVYLTIPNQSHPYGDIMSAKVAVEGMVVSARNSGYNITDAEMTEILGEVLRF